MSLAQNLGRELYRVLLFVICLLDGVLPTVYWTKDTLE